MATATMTEREATTLVRYRKEGYVAVFELDDPPANTYTHEMMRQLDDCILRARFDPDVHVIILRAGEKFFAPARTSRCSTRQTPRGSTTSASMPTRREPPRADPKLVIAAINGHCVVAGSRSRWRGYSHRAPDAGKIGSRVNLGVLPGKGGNQRLARLVGKANRSSDGHGTHLLVREAERWVSSRRAAEGTVDRVLLYAQQFTLPNKAAMAVGHIKRSSSPGSRWPSSMDSR